MEMPENVVLGDSNMVWEVPLWQRGSQVGEGYGMELQRTKTCRIMMDRTGTPVYDRCTLKCGRCALGKVRYDTRAGAVTARGLCVARRDSVACVVCCGSGARLGRVSAPGPRVGVDCVD